MKQHVADITCRLNIDQGLQAGHFIPQDNLTKMLFWKDPHHDATEFRLLGRHQIHESRNYVLISSLLADGPMQAEYRTNNYAVKISNCSYHTQIHTRK